MGIIEDAIAGYAAAERPDGEGKPPQPGEAALLTQRDALEASAADAFGRAVGNSPVSMDRGSGQQEGKLSSAISDADTSPTGTDWNPHAMTYASGEPQGAMTDGARIGELYVPHGSGDSATGTSRWMPPPVPDTTASYPKSTNSDGGVMWSTGVVTSPVSEPVAEVTRLPDMPTAPAADGGFADNNAANIPYDELGNLTSPAAGPINNAVGRFGVNATLVLKGGLFSIGRGLLEPSLEVSDMITAGRNYLTGSDYQFNSMLGKSAEQGDGMGDSLANVGLNVASMYPPVGALRFSYGATNSFMNGDYEGAGANLADLGGSFGGAGSTKLGNFSFPAQKIIIADNMQPESDFFSSGPIKYKFKDNTDLETHLSTGGSSINSVYGAHREDAFQAELKKIGGSEVGRRQIANGIDEVQYRTANGKLLTKTVYDPAKYTDQQMLDMSVRASQQAWANYHMTGIQPAGVTIDSVPFVTLFGAVKGGGFTVYSHPGR